jgi:hypothetical protein
VQQWRICIDRIDVIDDGGPVLSCTLFRDRVCCANAIAPSAGEVILTPQTRPHRIDVHHHHASPAFIAEIKARQTGQQPLMDWTPARSIEEMERAGV